MKKVPGTGTYTTTFTLPENWSDTGKIQFQADRFQGGTAAVWITTPVPVNMDRRTAGSYFMYSQVKIRSRSEDQFPA